MCEFFSCSCSVEVIFSERDGGVEEALVNNKEVRDETTTTTMVINQHEDCRFAPTELNITIVLRGHTSSGFGYPRAVG